MIRSECIYIVSLANGAATEFPFGDNNAAQYPNTVVLVRILGRN